MISIPCDWQVHFISAASENMISGSGMRPGDIVTASNGKTIEVYTYTLYISIVMRFKSSEST